MTPLHVGTSYTHNIGFYSKRNVCRHPACPFTRVYRNQKKELVMSTLPCPPSHNIFYTTCIKVVFSTCSFVLRKFLAQDCSFRMHFRVLVVTISISVANASDSLSITTVVLGGLQQEVNLYMVEMTLQTKV